MDAATPGSRRSSFCRSGWKTIVRARASIRGPTMSAADRRPVTTITMAAAPTSRVVVRERFMAARCDPHALTVPRRGRTA